MIRLLGFLGLAAAFFGLSAWFVIRALPGPPAAETAPASAVPAAVAEATPEQVHALCGACHAYPPPETFPRSAWRKEVKQGYDFLHESTLALPYPSLESVVRYYEARAPLEQMFGYSTAVRSLSQGRASSTMEPHSYREAPPEVLQSFFESGA